MRTSRFLRSIPSRLALALIRFYQVFISPLLGPACRYEPSCSCYAAQSVERHGFLRGSWLAAKRLCRCHPFTKRSGFDPVPPLRTATSSKEIE